MLTIPISHKTIFLFDHSNYFSESCAQAFDFDVSTKQKASAAGPQGSLKIEPVSKSLWTCSVEASLEYARIVYDLFPDMTKLIRMVVTKVELPLNGWVEAEQSFDHVCTSQFNN